MILRSKLVPESIRPVKVEETWGSLCPKTDGRRLNKKLCYVGNFL